MFALLCVVGCLSSGFGLPGCLADVSQQCSQNESEWESLPWWQPIRLPVCHHASPRSILTPQQLCSNTRCNDARAQRARLHDGRWATNMHQTLANSALLNLAAAPTIHASPVTRGALPTR